MSLENFAVNLAYTYKYKAIYLITIVGFAGMVYLLMCYLFRLLKIKNYKTN